MLCSKRWRIEQQKTKWEYDNGSFFFGAQGSNRLGAALYGHDFTAITLPKLDSKPQAGHAMVALLLHPTILDRSTYL